MGPPACKTVVALFSALCGLLSSPAFAIVGGTVDSADKYPFVVRLVSSLPDNRGTAYCSGFAVSKRTVITAAHCVAHDIDLWTKRSVVPRILATENGHTQEVSVARIEVSKAFIEPLKESGESFNKRYSEAVRKLVESKDNYDENILRVMEEFDNGNTDVATIETTEDILISSYARPISDLLHPSVYDKVAPIERAGTILYKLIEIFAKANLKVDSMGVELVASGYGLSACPGLDLSKVEKGSLEKRNLKNCSMDGKRRFIAALVAPDYYCVPKSTADGKSYSSMSYAPWCTVVRKSDGYIMAGDSGGPLGFWKGDQFFAVGVMSMGGYSRFATPETLAKRPGKVRVFKLVEANVFSSLLRNVRLIDNEDHDVHVIEPRASR